MIPEVRLNLIRMAGPNEDISSGVVSFSLLQPSIILRILRSADESAIPLLLPGMPMLTFFLELH